MSAQQICVRPAQEVDTVAMVKVNVDTLRATYPAFYPADLLAARNYETVEAAWRHMLWESPEIENYALVAENDAGQIVGVLICGPSTSHAAYQGEVFTLFVLPQFHKQGIGKKLMRCAAEQLFALGMVNMIVWVLADNPARQFYEAIGGKWVQEREIKRGDVMMREIGYGWKNIETAFSSFV